MNWKTLLRSISIFTISAACVDRLAYDLDGIATIIPVVFGYISDQPGPYQITVSKSFDIESDSTATPLSVKSLTLSDNTGVTEKLTEVKEGLYETSPAGIQGIVGRVYTLRIELLDGRVYESFSDTLLNSGTLDSVYFDFVKRPGANNTQSKGFDILFNSTATVESNFHFLWNFTGTYQAETNPELNDKACYLTNGQCNFVAPCTGLRNIAVPAYPPIFEKVGPCECCTCWYTFYDRSAFLNDGKLDQVRKFSRIKLYELPLNAWYFSHKVHFKIDQFSISRQTFRFFKSIKDQQEAVNSIFQPVSGKIPSNFVQLSGSEFPIAGIFYATSISTKSDFIYRHDVPSGVTIPSNKAVLKATCMEAFPNATNIKPLFWD